MRIKQGALLAIVLLWSMSPAVVTAALSSDEEILNIYFLNAGQGDSSLIVSEDKGEKEAVLIDGGRRKSGKQIVQTLKRMGIEKLEWVVATHPDIDHIGGLLEVFQEIEIEHILDSGKMHHTNTYKQYRKRIKKKGIDFYVAEEGEALDTSVADIKILHGYSDSRIRNSSSIVLRLDYGSSSVLFTGDATVEAENDMMKKYNVEADVLKVAHHGSATSSSAAFIKAADPEAAVLSYDEDNEFGHPNAGVVKRIRRTGAVIFSTVDSGIHMKINKSSWAADKQTWQGRGKTYPAASPKNNGKTDRPDRAVAVNHATSKELQMLPDIGRVVAANIVDYRHRNGAFHTTNELLEVNGIGRASLRKIEPFIVL